MASWRNLERWGRRSTRPVYMPSTSWMPGRELSRVGASYSRTSHVCFLVAPRTPGRCYSIVFHTTLLKATLIRRIESLAVRLLTVVAGCRIMAVSRTSPLLHYSCCERSRVLGYMCPKFDSIHISSGKRNTGQSPQTTCNSPPLSLRY